MDPIGKPSIHFRGIFDGGGHTVSGLKIDKPSTTSLGLFAYLDTGSVIQNLKVSGTVSGLDYIGGIVGWINEGTIENCCSDVAVSGSSNVGGIAGFSGYSAIKNCHNSGSITFSGANAGGIAGQSAYGSIANCFNTGTVSGSSDATNIGSITGNNIGTVSNRYYHSTGIGGIGPGYSGDASPKSESEFHSGEVAWLLQNGQETQDTQVWGQTVGSGYPELTANASMRVYKVTFATEEDPEYAVRYTNRNGTVSPPPHCRLPMAFSSATGPQ